jgi:hypothetical protein
MPPTFKLLTAAGTKAPLHDDQWAVSYMGDYTLQQEGADILYLRHRIEHSISTAAWLKPVSMEVPFKPLEVCSARGGWGRDWTAVMPLNMAFQQPGAEKLVCVTGGTKGNYHWTSCMEVRGWGEGVVL